MTTVRDAGTGAGIEMMVVERQKSEANEIVAPRLVLCQRRPLPLGSWDEGNTPDKARVMVRRFKELGADCVKVSKSPGQYPDVLEAIVDEARVHGMEVMVDLKVSETSALVASTLGVTSIEHFYGGRYHREWKTSDEVAWRQFFGIWMKYVLEFHRRGGLLTAGSDQGDIGGIGLVRELELLQEAGIHPLDIFKVATTNAAKALALDRLCGVRVGCAADLAIVNGNPVDNLKVLYGRGYGFYGIVPRERQAEMGGVKWTIKDGVLFDAQALLREVEWYVQETKRNRTPVTNGR